MARIDRAIANLLHEKNLGLPPMFTRSMMQKDFFIKGKDEEQVSEKGGNYL